MVRVGFLAKRALVLVLMSAPGYVANLLFVAFLVSVIRFPGVSVLSPVVLGDVVGVAVNLALFDWYWKIVRRWKLVKEAKPAEA